MGELKNTVTPTPAVELEDVRYTYPQAPEDPETEGHKQAPTLSLDGINMRVNPGETVLLVGASGSGKSTCLRTFNTLVPQLYEGELSGTVNIAGTDVSTLKLADMASRSAMVFQNPRTQFFTSQVRSEMALTLENLGVDPQQIIRTINDISEQTGIGHLLGRELHGLSGGELQRVACACALTAQVPLLLFDEPTSNLSPHAVEQFRELLLHMKAQGKTMVIAEHRIHFMRGVADRVYRMQNGAIVGEYTGEEFFTLSDDQRTSLGLRAFTEPTAQITAPPNTDHRQENTGLMVRNLRFSYRAPRKADSELVLNIESMHFPAGKVTALRGPNGAGKSTLARVICGLARPLNGSEIILDGKRLSPKERMCACGMVMQDVRRQLFAESVADEISMGLEPDTVTAADVTEILESLDLTPVAHSHPAAISGGQQQRLVIGATIAAHKRVVIFDEPTSGVDLGHLRSVAAHLRNLAEEGAVVICITHDAELVQECADYAVDLVRLNENPEARQISTAH